MNTDNYTKKELDALEEQTNNIAANLKYIAEHYQAEKLDQLKEQLDRICDSLRYIADHDVQNEDLVELTERTFVIANNLDRIAENQ
jgi:hypothetical protein